MSESGQGEGTRRVLATSALVVAVVAGIAISVIGSIFYAFHCLDGDGGVPYVARDSLQKDVCDATGNGWLLLALMVAACSGVASLAHGALRRWRARVGSGLVAIALTAGVVAAPLAVFWAINLPSDSCTSEELAEVDQWRAAGARGDPPHDCDRY